jgi:hypothetical protein
MYDHRLGTFLAQFNPTSGLWSGAADVLKQVQSSPIIPQTQHVNIEIAWKARLIWIQGG